MAMMRVFMTGSETDRMGMPLPASSKKVFRRASAVLVPIHPPTVKTVTKPGSTPPPLHSLVGVPYAVLEDLFDHVPDTAFFVKDRQGRYIACNQSLVLRVGLLDKAALLGRTVTEIFPTVLAEQYRVQDAEVLSAGKPVIDRLELHWHANRRSGWCLTTKLPLLDAAGAVIGLIGVSRDLAAPNDTSKIPPGLTKALEHLDRHYADAVTPASLAKQAGLGQVRFARLIKRIYRITPSQLITQTRLSVATRLLQEPARPIAEVAHACGFYDHSAFTRAFHSATGLTPTEFRRRKLAR
jgi:AraC-like DNA-binding protein